MKSSACLLLLCTLLPFARAQQEAPSPTAATTLNVKVRVMEFDAVVRDRQGQHVRNLARENFTVSEDSKRQTIRYFTEDDDLPLTVGLMVDTSASQIPFVEEERIASRQFFTEMLTRPQDNAFLIRFDTGVYLLSKMTASMPKLESGLAQLTTSHEPRKGPGGGTLLYDAICSAVTVAFPAERPGHHGRHALVILTDGDDQGSTHNYSNATECAQIANVTIYTVFYSTNDPGPRIEDNPAVPISARMSGRTRMARISAMTGGRLFSVNRSTPIDSIYQQIQNDLRHQYRIGYTPPKSEPYDYHQIELKLSDRKLKVQARVGYFTPKEAR